jgi:biopolymer transport protein ExbD
MYKACIENALLFFTAALMLSGCFGSRVIEDTRTPEIAIDQFGAISVMGKSIKRDNLARAVRKAGFKQDQEINILIPENPDRQLMASIAGELRRKGYSRIIFVSDKKTYSELGK